MCIWTKSDKALRGGNGSARYRCVCSLPHNFSPPLAVGEHGSSAIMRAWVSTDEYWQTRRDTLKSIKETFDQLDVHMDKV